jgi:hypothetical protein
LNGDATSDCSILWAWDLKMQNQLGPPAAARGEKATKADFHFWAKTSFP